ncbi:MAG: hypothetical protein IKN54_00125, partial [Lachnospiraceae bacterium]|nr:hypothetical protein [Lachnospiraceae bacterium]
FVYGLKSVKGQSKGVANSDMYIGSTSSYVYSYQSTAKGTSSVPLGDSETATYFVRTMTFGANTVTAFTAEYMVRPYVVLDDGTIVYGRIGEFTVYRIADYLYQNQRMNSLQYHNYLYDSILSVVDSDYRRVEYDWGGNILNP